MKNSLFSNFRTTLKNIPAMRILVIASLFFFSSQLDLVLAQAGPKLSIQGILKKANGEAVDDGNYDLVFKLYTVATLGTPVWTESQMGVEVISGIYSTVLGNSTPLSTVTFNQVYYLAVAVGTINSPEMLPRVQLTSAPYAFSLIGSSNLFPSSGMVLADTLNVKTNVLARFGAPGANGVSKNGYAFNGTSGDKDSGLFSTGLGQVSLYSDNVKMLTVTPDSVAIRKDLRLATGGNINYNGMDDWRLVEVDDFESGVDNWKLYDTWNSTTNITPSVSNFNDFAGKALVSTFQNKVFKKKFTLPGSSTPNSYTYIKVVFKYFYMDTWDLDGKDIGWAGFSKTENCSSVRVGWLASQSRTGNAWGLDVSGFDAAATFNAIGYSDQWSTEQMVGKYPSGPTNADFWVVFGYGTNESPATENFGIGMVEIWVK